MTEGYFFPHTFEVTEQARDAPDDGHLLAVEVACPPQRDRTTKRTITGVFSHWDNLDPDWNPGGIWRPVRLRDTGPVRIKWLRALCSEATETRGRLLLDVTLGPRRGTRDPCRSARASSRPSPGPDGTTLGGGDPGRDARGRRQHPDPHRRGRPPAALVAVAARRAAAVRRGGAGRGRGRAERRPPAPHRVPRDPAAQLAADGQRRAHVPDGLEPRPDPHGARRGDRSPELLRDVQLAVDANLDLLRIHAHVTRLELYDAADAAGLLLWQDLPLQWGYARGTRKEAVRQAREMVDLLGHHPSIALWCAHNEPLAIDLQPGDAFRARDVATTAASMFLPVVEQGRARPLDRPRAAQGRSRPARSTRTPACCPGIGSGGTDTHFYFGWYHGRMDGLAPRAARRAPPGPLRHRVRRAGRPRLRRLHAAASAGPTSTGTTSSSTTRCQKRYFDQHVPPALFDSFAAWRDATQHYQAALIQLQVEDLRRLKHDPTGGFCHFCFADGHPVRHLVRARPRPGPEGRILARCATRAGPCSRCSSPRAGLVHVVSEHRAPLPGAVVEADVDGRRHGVGRRRPGRRHRLHRSSSTSRRRAARRAHAAPSRRSARWPTRTTTSSSGSVSSSG